MLTAMPLMQWYGYALVLLPLLTIVVSVWSGAEGVLQEHDHHHDQQPGQWLHPGDGAGQLRGCQGHGHEHGESASRSVCYTLFYRV